MASPYPCPGRNRVSDNRKWYIPAGKTSHECTYCEECYNTYVKATPQDHGFTTNDNLYSCNCDYPKDYTGKCLMKNDFRIMICDSKTNKTLEIIPNSLAQLNGVAQFVLPTCTNYYITIENMDNNTKTWFSFANGKVGDKPIIINNGQLIYHNKSLNIEGFKTGTKDSFLFYSPSNQEKWEGKSIEGVNVTNIINLKLKKYNREPRYTMRESYGYGGGLECLGMPRGGDGGMYLCGTRGEPEVFAAGAISGGATLSGGSYVDNIRTTRTMDTFTQIGDDLEFIIQLVNTQTDEEKYNANKQYNMKIDFQKREELLNKKKILEASIKNYQQSLEEARQSLEKVEDELGKYAYLGSTDKETYVMQFNV